MNIKIITDSASDIELDFAKQNDITILPVEITFEDNGYYDGLNITKDEFYKKLMNCKTLPKTSLINQMRWQEVFSKKASDTNTTYLIMPMSKELSGSYNAAKLALAEIGNPKNLVLLDTNQITITQGAIIIETIKLIKTCTKLEEVLEKVNYLISHCVLLAYVDDLKYLKMGGRLNSSAAIIGSMLQIKPILTFTDGKIDAVAKAIGSTKACKTIIEKTLKNIDTNYPIYFGRTYYTEPLETFKKLCEKQLPLTGNEQTLVLGATVGTHIGPSAVGIVYFKKD